MYAINKSVLHQNGKQAGELMTVASIVMALIAVVLLVLPRMANAEGVCPNAELRVEAHSTSLPDCRAYEQVSPAFKNGQPALKQRVGVGGSTVSFDSLGAFDNPPNDGTAEGGVYVATRAAAGWSTVPINPSAEQFQVGLAFTYFVPSESGETTDFTPTLGETLFTQAPIGAKPIDSRLYRRDPDGAFTEVGPISPPSRVAGWTQGDAEEDDAPLAAYAGATHDLSHIFFVQGTGHNWYWPGDSSVRTSLYEYTGTGNTEPSLVGIKPGPEESQSRPAEGARLVSQCGIILGGGARGGSPTDETEDEYNSISTLPASEEGRTVFFTALAKGPECEASGGTVGPPANELYARIAGSKTIAISEPSVDDCASCDVANPKPALFQGASADGSRVFFLSEQSLFSGARGEAGVDLYEFDFNARNPHEKISLIATNLSSYNEGAPLAGVLRVTEDGSRVYFASTAKLAANTDAKGQEAVVGEDNLYVYDTETGNTTFVATLSPGDAPNWNPSDTRPSEATPDGRYLLFLSMNDLTQDASGEGGQLYRYDADTNSLVRVSIGSDGFNDNGNGGAPAGFAEQSFGNVDRAGPQAVSITSDGSKVFFRSREALTPQALDSACAFEEEGACLARAQNVYEWEDGHVYLLSDGQDAHAVFRGSAVTLIGASPSGSDVFFTTADALVSQDGDTQQDIYDARVDGGFPAPASPSACTGDCQGSGTVPPVFASPASASLTGSGNLTLQQPSTSVVPTKAERKAVKCGKGRKLKRGRCVKPVKTKKKIKRNGKSGLTPKNRRGNK
jgi:hypothetical protein